MKTFDMIPIACDMSAISEEQMARYGGSRELLREACVGYEEHPDGFSFRYPAEPELLSAAGDLIGVEQSCCAFLQYDLAVPAGAQEFTLRLIGSPAAKAFVVENFVEAISGDLPLAVPPAHSS